MNKAKIIQILNLIVVVLISLQILWFLFLVFGAWLSEPLTGFDYDLFFLLLFGIIEIAYVIMIIRSFKRTNLDNKYFKRAFIISVLVLVMKFIPYTMASLVYYVTEILLTIGFIIFIIGYKKNKKTVLSKQPEINNQSNQSV